MSNQRSSYETQIIEESENFAKKLSDAGIRINRSKNFVAYATIFGSDKMFKLESLAGNLADAKDEFENSDHNTIEDALYYLMGSEERPEIEICNNSEWLEIYGGFDGGEEDAEGSHVDMARVESARENLKNEFDEAYFYDAKGQRMFCHGWNGAHFTHRNSIAGTFEVLTDSGLEKFMEI